MPVAGRRMMISESTLTRGMASSFSAICVIVELYMVTTVSIPSGSSSALASISTRTHWPALPSNEKKS